MLFIKSDLEGHLRSLTMALFKRSYVWSVVTISPSCVHFQDIITCYLACTTACDLQSN